jgi:IS1 family transposase
MLEQLTRFKVMNRLSVGKRSAIIRALVEGNSIRATARLTGTAKATVLKLLVEMGEFCSIYQHHRLVNLPCRRIEADEIWSFVGAKAKNARRAGHGDLWTFTAMDPDSKLMVSWIVGERSPENAKAIMEDVVARLANRVQITTDGHHMYLTAVEEAFGWNGADYAQLVKSYGVNPEFEQKPANRRYSPAVCVGAEKTWAMGKPDMAKVSTSYVERTNLSMRMGMRRFTRLTNAFSKKAENHAHAVSLFFMFYNFCRAHQTLTKAADGIKTTPAMAAGLTDRIWTVEDILKLMDPEQVLQSN